MDEDRIILFDVDGNIQNELVDSQIRKFRGLSYISIQNKINLVTTEKTRHAVKLVFLHLGPFINDVIIFLALFGPFWPFLAPFSHFGKWICTRY